MKKRFVCALLSFVFLFGLFAQPFTVSAADNDRDPEKLQQEINALPSAASVAELSAEERQALSATVAELSNALSEALEAEDIDENTFQNLNGILTSLNEALAAVPGNSGNDAGDSDGEDNSGDGEDSGTDTPTAFQLLQKKLQELPDKSAVAAMSDEEKEAFGEVLLALVDETDAALEAGDITDEEYEELYGTLLEYNSILIGDAPSQQDGNTFNVGTKEELDAAVNTIKNAPDGGEFVINLTADISGVSITLNNSSTTTVTLYGNGHTLTFSNQGTANPWNHNTLNLGSEDGGDANKLTITRGSNSDTPGVIYVDKGGAVNMYSGVTIKDCQGSNYYGGAVSVRAGVFHMYGGTIENCGIRSGSNCYGGAVGVINGGQFIMDGGEIKNCYVISDYYGTNKWQSTNCAGGGVWVFNGSSFVMNGGSITGCRATNISSGYNPCAVGGGVALVTSYDAYFHNVSGSNGYGYLDDCFIMNGGSIANCSSDVAGGGLFAGGAYLSCPSITNSSAFSENPNPKGVTINAGSITGNHSESGGGIFFNWIRTHIDVKNCAITNNTADDGGGVTIYSRWTNVTFDNCTITGNTAEYGDGGGLLALSNTDSANGTVVTNSTLCNNTAGNSSSDVGAFAGSRVRLMAADSKAPVYTGAKPADQTNMPIDNWYLDVKDDRYADQEPAQRTVYTDYADFTGTDDAPVMLIAAPNKVVVTFDQNYDSKPENTQTVIPYSTLASPMDPAPTRDGYTFGGWYTDAACTTAYDFSTEVTESITLYAKWTNAAVTVTFNANGHGTAPDAQTVNSGSKATEPTAPTETGYTFGGWYTEAACTTAFDFDSEVTESITLYARWTLNSYPVSFNANGHGTAPETQTVSHNAAATAPQDPTVAGYAFGGWYTSPSCETSYDFSTPVTGPVTLYAKWTPITYTVAFNANGHGTAPASQTVNHGSTASEPQAPAEEGYTFGGWYTSAACTTKYDFSAPVTGPVTLYAKWTPVTYTVTFNANGHGTAPDAQTVQYKGNAYQPTNPRALGYVFGGWYTDASCSSDTRYDFSSEVTGDITLYAKWTVASPTAQTGDSSNPLIWIVCTLLGAAAIVLALLPLRKHRNNRYHR